MNQHLTELLIAAALVAAGPGGACAEDRDLSPPAPPAAPGLGDMETRVRHELESTQRQVEAGLAQAQRAMEVAQAAVLEAVPDVARNVGAVLPRSRRASGRTLVIRSSELGPKAHAEVEEDLSVMSRVFDKALSERFEGEHGYRPAGIDLLLTPGGSSIRSLYLEGYGSLFLLSVNFPLLESVESTAEDKASSETTTAWDEAREELYGESGGGSSDVKFALRLTGVPGRVAEYEARKVDQLKETLLEALKNATNIRHLEPNDHVTVCVFGPASGKAEPGRNVRQRVERRDAGPARQEHREVVVVQKDGDAPARGTVLTLHARKSDIDAFAKGSLAAEAFRRAVSIQAYPGAGAWNGPFGWMGLEW